MSSAPGNTSPQDPPLREARGTSALLLTGLALVLALYLAHSLRFWSHVNDDAYITFRYAWMWSHGFGPVFNPGEFVEGYSNFLLVLLLVPIAWCGGADVLPLAAKLIGIAAGLVTLVVVFALGRALARTEDALRARAGWAGLLAAAVVAVCPPFAANSTTGLETTLFGLTVTLGVALGIRSVKEGAWRGAGLALAAMLLARPEGVLLAGIYFVTQVLAPPLGIRELVRALRTVGLAALRHPKYARHLLPDGAIVLAVGAAHLVFRRLTYGEWVPNTYFAKVGGFWAVDAWQYIWDGVAAPLFGGVGLLAALLGWSRLRIPGLGGAVLLTVGIAGALLPAVTGVDWMIGQRMSMPFVPLLALAAALGWMRLLPQQPKPLAWAGPLGIVALVALWQLGTGRALRETVAERAAGYAAGHRMLADWLVERAGPGATIALLDIGIVGWRCLPQRILDVSGLTDRYIAHSPGPFLFKRYDPDYVLAQRPQFIVLAVYWPTGLAPGSGSVVPWTPMEEEILRAPEFARCYQDPFVAARPPAARLEDRLSAELGADRVFVHRRTGRGYALAVFERRCD